MGIQWSSTSTRMMKSIFFAAVIAAAYADSESEADTKASQPTSYGYPIMEFNPYSYGMQPYGFAGFPHMMKRSADADGFYAYPGMGYSSYSYGMHPNGGFSHMMKRSADADAYHHGYNFGGFRGHHFHAMGKRSADVNAY